MRNWKIGRLAVLLLSLFFLTACGSTLVSGHADSLEEATASFKMSGGSQEEAKLPSYLTVHFIDVGQGDAALLTCDGEAMLIDAGDNTKGTAVQLYLSKQGVTSLKYLVLTHPDADHIGGADVIVSKLDIENVLMSPYRKDSRTYEELEQALDYRGYQWSVPNVGDTYALGTAAFQILGPNKAYSDPNNASLGLLVTYGRTKFLFTGDAEEEAEADMLDNGISPACDVYKAGHHGSRTSNSKALLEAARPTYVVVSCGEDNSYGHPHAEPMNSFRSMGVKLFRTDEQGTVVAESNGTDIIWNCAPTESWKAGEGTAASEAAAYVCNTNTGKFHYPDCGSVEEMGESNKKAVNAAREELISQGYVPCKICSP
ncbi:MAG: MBL fold metallo-hydrolase [Lachnospiraceae bacterium]|nr:MBL fold metallo-hydrolase [Lachnospiraceae bacterium]